MSDKSKSVVHRPGVFKQPNKTHKTGRHRSKGLINKDAKGRKEISIEHRSKKKIENKKDRINKLGQLRKQKRDAIVLEKRSRGGLTAPPFLVIVTSLNINSTNKLFELFSKTSDLDVIQKENSLLIHSLRFKQRFEFVFVESGKLNLFLDLCLVADSLIFNIPVEGDVIDSWGELALNSIFSQGLPATLFISTLHSNVPLKKLSEFKKNAMKPLEKRFPDHKLLLVETDMDVHLLLRNLSNHKLNKLKFREHRPHLFIDSIDTEPTTDSKVITKIRGYLRGGELSPNQLLQICGWDRCQISRICTLKNAHLGNLNQLLVDETYLPDASLQESIESEVLVDPMQDEQTWPTQEELIDADIQLKKLVKKVVPKGSSDYQAAWLSDYEDSDEEMAESESEDDDADLKAVDDELSDNEMENLVIDSSEMGSTRDRDENYDENFDEIADQNDLEKYKEERMQEMFPDEIDTPMNLPARIRFQKFRGLRSFRTSPWDFRENLPAEYSRITKFGNFKSMCQRILAKKNKVNDDDKNLISGGSYVEIHVAIDESKLAGLAGQKPTIAFGLLPFEQRMSVMHFVIRRSPVDRIPVKSKELMAFRVGCYMFTARPIFSQHTNGNKHKFEKFFPLDGVLVATVYAPLILPPAPVLMFRRTSDGEDQLVGTGSVLSANPDRIIVKRVVLSGHPFKINKRSVVVRYMFFNRDDIVWFKPVELRTKYGRRGHIKEPLGTHGHMKCVFDSQLKSQDTVLLNLYKRVFPKWTYEAISKINTADNLNMDNY